MSQRITASLLAALTFAGTAVPLQARAQQSQSEEFTRRAKTKVQPIYPELAKKMGIRGTVRVEIIVAPNGSVKQTRIVGGHPVLATAAEDAAKKWRFEPAQAESTGVIDFDFEPR